MSAEEMKQRPGAVPRLGDRALFPDLEPHIYLNHAAISPPSEPVRRAVEGVLADFARRGVAAAGDWFRQRDRTREKLAQLIGAAAEDIALVPNTTRGVTDVALCFPWRKGDRVVLFEGEFPANVTPWQRAAELFGLELVWLDLRDYHGSHEAGLERLERALRDGVRLVAVSAVEFQTGLRMPVEAMTRLCHDRGAEIFVDAIQACGSVPMDVRRSGVDYLSCGGHKWLMGPEGAGFLYVRPERVEGLEPRVAGWLSHESPLDFLFRGRGHLRYDRSIRSAPSMVEGGAMNALGYAGLEASVELLLALGVETIHAHVQAYLDALEPPLVERGFRSLRASEPGARSCILSFEPPRDVDVVSLHRELGERGVSCSIPDGFLRFAPGWPNDLSEVGAVVRAVDAVLTGT